MKPKRSAFARWYTSWVLVGAIGLSGCSAPLLNLRGQSPEPDVGQDDSEEMTKLIGDVAVPWNMNYMKVESVALVTGLDNTGSEPPPSAQRDMLVREMQSHDVAPGPSQILRSPTTSMVLIRGYLPPGVQKGDHFDLEVYLPEGSRTTSLRGGWLMQSRMRELAVLDGTVRTGHILALGSGPVFVDGLLKGEDQPIHATRGRVLGGGIALESRSLGLVVRSSESSVRTSAMIGAAINARFHTFERTVQKEVAKPKTDNFIELTVHPRYRHNLERYVRVVRSIALGERSEERAARLQLLERMLQEPTTAASAALQLEAIGHDAVPVLKTALVSSEVEPRFYAAEALAYLDEADAAEVLGKIAQEEPAFRWHALTALSVMDHIVAYDALHKLLNSDSAETRYGAFRALRARNHQDPVVRGKRMDDFAYHVISTTGPPMVHLSWSKGPELVLFGHDQRIRPPAALFAGKEILVRRLPDGQIKVSRFAVGLEDQHEICSDRLDDVVQAVVKIGGGYGEVMQLLLAAEQQETLNSRLVIDALPQRGRRFHRSSPDEQLVENDDASWSRVASPLPDLFKQREVAVDDGKSDLSPHINPPAETEEASGDFFGRMTNWFRR